MITELRRYRIAPGRLDSWVEFFSGAVKQHVERGMRVEYAGVDRETSTFIWMRSFADEADRMASKDGFYGSEWWLEQESFAMDHILEYDVTFLEATVIREGGDVVDVAVVDAAEQPGSRANSPPGGWQASTRRTYVPSRPAPP